MNPTNAAIFFELNVILLPIFLFFFIKKNKALTGRILSMSLLIVGFLYVFFLLKITFIDIYVNMLCESLAYSGYCCIFSCLFFTLKRLSRIFIVTILSIPIIAGYLLGTIGILGLGFMIFDWAAPPVKVEQIEDNLQCRITQWGSAISDTGYTVHLYKHWAFMPGLEREVARISVNESNDATFPRKANCRDALKSYIH